MDKTVAGVGGAITLMAQEATEFVVTADGAVVEVVVDNTSTDKDVYCDGYHHYCCPCSIILAPGIRCVCVKQRGS